MNALLKYRYSFFAGACAAGGSFFGKLPGFLTARNFVLNSDKNEGMNFLIDFTLLHLLPIALMVLCNLLNWRYFLRALQAVEHTLTATVLTAASNYIISIIFGTVFYSEPISLLTVLGSTLIVVGLWLLCGSKEQNDDHKLKHI